MTVREIVERRRFLAGTGAEVRCGDVAEELRTMPENSFDACLTDPPYGLSFMGKEWDHGVPGVETWHEVYRVLKPGAMMLAFGGTRTHHRLMCAVEDAGFEIRDCLMWLHGQGFPKGLDIGKALDKLAGAEREVVGRRSQTDIRGDSYTNRERHDKTGSVEVLDTLPATDEAKAWDGYNVALKPAWEPILLAMKPLDGTFAENALKWGVAGLNIAGCRIPSAGGRHRIGEPSQERRYTDHGSANMAALPGPRGGDPQGRWPANLLLDEETAEMVDGQSGITRSAGGKNTPQHGRELRMGCTSGQGSNAGGLGDVGGASRYFKVVVVDCCETGEHDASRFQYVAKASRSERGEGNAHPTVKPLKLCEYLARLLLPPQRNTPRRLLVPFSGSGSEMIGALRAGWERVTGIDNSREYCELAKRRIGAAVTPGSTPAPASPPPG
jgi:site-specific DNA-methyltransferase (adenine-specific)